MFVKFLLWKISRLDADDQHFADGGIRPAKLDETCVLSYLYKAYRDDFLPCPIQGKSKGNCKFDFWSIATLTLTLGSSLHAVL